MFRPLLLGAFASLCALSLTARAHYLWIEAEAAGEARVYFGEYNEGVREKAGGRLDERSTLTGTIASAGGTSEPLRFTTAADHFRAPVAGSGWLLVSDVASEVKDWTSSDIGIVKPMFYARAAVANQLTPAKPSLPLDILPNPENPRELQVFFQQQPLKKAKLLVYAPNLWLQELPVDDNGKVTITTPWPGRYVVEVIHKERQPGEHKGVRYEAVRHRVTFSHVY